MTDSMKYILASAAGLTLIILLTRWKKGTGRRLSNYGPGMLSGLFVDSQFFKSNVATQNGITEQFDMPAKSIYDNGRGLAQFILDPLQIRLFPAAITINSWYRSPELNQFLVDSPLYNAVPNSTHLTGGTIDVAFWRPDPVYTSEITKQNNLIVAAVLEMNLPFDRMLLEGGTLERPAWIQLEYSPNQTRRQILVLPNGLTGYEISINEAKSIFGVV